MNAALRVILTGVLLVSGVAKVATPLPGAWLSEWMQQALGLLELGLAVMLWTRLEGRACVVILCFGLAGAIVASLPADGTHCGCMGSWAVLRRWRCASWDSAWRPVRRRC